MKLTLLSVSNAEDLDRERVVLRADSDIDLSYYAIFCCLMGVKTVRAGSIPYTYWFPQKEIKSNDLIVLYSKTGKSSEKEISNERTSHFFYWRKDEPIWTSERRAVVVSTPAWKIAQISPKEDEA